MNKKEALKIVLADVCCNNGKNFCNICPLSKEEGCKYTHYDEEQLIEAVKTLRDN